MGAAAVEAGLADLSWRYTSPADATFNSQGQKEKDKQFRA